MAFDFTPLLATNYAEYSAPAMITPIGSGGTVELNVIDMTEGAPVADSRNAMLQTIKPVAMVQASDLVANNIAPAELDNGTIILNYGTSGQETWTIESHRLMPMGAGELSGEVMLILVGE